MTELECSAPAAASAACSGSLPPEARSFFPAAAAHHRTTKTTKERPWATEHRKAGLSARKFQPSVCVGSSNPGRTKARALGNSASTLLRNRSSRSMKSSAAFPMLRPPFAHRGPCGDAAIHSDQRHLRRALGIPRPVTRFLLLIHERMKGALEFHGDEELVPQDHFHRVFERSRGGAGLCRHLLLRHAPGSRRDFSR